MGYEKQPLQDLSFYKGMIEDIVKSWNLNPQEIFDANLNVWRLVQGSAYFDIGIYNFQNGGDYLVVSSPICKIPANNLLAFYRRLLEMNDTMLGVKFSVQGNQVWMLAQRECEGMDIGEAKRLIDNLRFFADEVDDELMNKFGATK